MGEVVFQGSGPSRAVRGTREPCALPERPGTVPVVIVPGNNVSQVGYTFEL